MYANLVLTKEALLTILAADKFYELKLPQEDLKELRLACQYVIDKDFLDKNTVATPMEFYS
jgi:hypothetical protein